jgi:hypothetical protein
MSRPWLRTADGYTLMHGGHRWRVRGPILGKPMFWLYRDGSRYTPTGDFEDALNFASARAAMAFVEALPGLPGGDG